MSNVNMQTLDVLHFLQEVLAGESQGIPDDVLEEAGEQLKESLRKQFNTPRSEKFRLRASNIGRPLCQLQHEKMGTKGIPLNPSQLLNFVFGDIVEVVYMAILKSIYGKSLKGEQEVSVELAGVTIKGHTDLSIAGYVHDVKSASHWSFTHKFDTGDTMKSGDAFGYIPQLVFYSRGGAGKIGGWFVMDKSNGDVKFVPLELSKEEEQQIWQELEDKVRKLNDDAPFEKCFDDEPEVFYKKETGNRILGTSCRFCQYRNTCWPNLQVRPKIPSKSKNPQDEYYTHVAEEYANNDDGK